MDKIDRVKHGQKPHLLQPEFANKVIDAVNAIGRMEVQPPGIGEVEVGGDKVILSLETEPLAVITADGDGAFLDIPTTLNNTIGAGHVDGPSGAAKETIRNALGIPAMETVLGWVMVRNGNTVDFETRSVIVLPSNPG